MRFSKVALLSALARLSALSHGIFGAGVTIPSSYTNPAFILPNFGENPSKSKQNKLSQKKRRLIKRRLGHK